MAYTQIPALIDFTAGTTIVSADVDANGAAIRTVVNGLVTGTDTIQAARINAVSGAGIGLGTAAVDNSFVSVGGAFTSGGASTNSFGLDCNVLLTGAAGDTGALVQCRVNGTITTQGQSETISQVVGLFVQEPAITVGSGDTVTNAVSLYVAGAPTEGSNNYALWVDAGTTRLDGGLLLSGATGVDVNPGSDADADLVTVGVTGAPRLWWDESEDVFTATHGLSITDLATGITASTTQTQGQQPLTAMFNIVETVANDNDVVTLPAAAAGKFCYIRHADTSNSANDIQVFPASGDAINGIADTSVTIGFVGVVFYAVDGTTWWGFVG